MTKQENTPKVTEQTNRRGNDKDEKGISKENTGRGCPKGEGVNGSADEQRNSQLKEICEEKADDPKCNPPAVPDEVFLQGSERLKRNEELGLKRFH
jgi:hypothetical protein